jgi:hypothetical protein
MPTIRESNASVTVPKPSVLATIFIVMCGVVMPTVTGLIELLTRMCAETFLDPLPTAGHVFAIATVPLAGALSVWTLWRRDGASLDAAIFAQAFAVAISGVYTLMFAPLMSLALYALTFRGLGLLPLTPALSLVAGLLALLALRGRRRAFALPPRRGRVWRGLAAGVGTLVLLAVPPLVTRVLLARAASEDPTVSESGVTWLRRIGQRQVLLRAATVGGHGPFDLMGACLDAAAPIPHLETHMIYQEVTGRSADVDRIPRVRASWFHGLL